MSQENIRAFICLTFPDEIMKEITRIQSLILKTKFTGKITEPENLHLTLKFLGEMPLEKLDEIKSLLSLIKFKPFEATLQHTGTFNHHKLPRIAWLKISSKELFELQEQIDDSLSALLPKENRFMSHLTLARIKYVKSPELFVKYVKQIKPKKLKFQVSSFKLMSSELKPLGPSYTLLQEYNL